MSVRLRTIAAALLTLALMVSCTAVPGRNAPSTNVQPSYLCTGGSQAATPFPCDKARYDEQQKTKELEDQAKAVYERYWVEYMRLTAAGGATESTPELKATLADPLLSVLVTLLRYQSDRRVMPIGELHHSLTLATSTMESFEDSIVTIVGCEDVSQTWFRGPDRKDTQGTVTRETRYFKFIDGELRMFNGSSEVVATC